MHKIVNRALVIGLGFFASLPAFADWDLEASASRFSFGSVKKGSIGEVHHFKELSGRVAEDGDFSLTIDLASVETFVPIRNERMRKFLFDVATHPVAVFSGAIELDGLDQMAVGTVTQRPLKGSLMINGQSQIIDTDVMIVRLGEDRVMVVPQDFLFITAQDYGLGDGVAKLMELAALPSIAGAVPVSFRLVFAR